MMEVIWCHRRHLWQVAVQGHDQMHEVQIAVQHWTAA